MSLKGITAANIKRREVSKRRYEATKKLLNAGVESKEVAGLIGVSEPTVYIYSKFDTFDDYIEDSRQRYIDRIAAKKAQEEQPVEEKAFEVEPVEVAVLDEPDTTKTNAIVEVIELKERVNELEKRLEWIESNAVISNTRRNLERRNIFSR